MAARVRRTRGLPPRIRTPHSAFRNPQGSRRAARSVTLGLPLPFQAANSPKGIGGHPVNERPKQNGHDPALAAPAQPARARQLHRRARRQRPRRQAFSSYGGGHPRQPRRRNARRRSRSPRRRDGAPDAAVRSRARRGGQRRLGGRVGRAAARRRQAARPERVVRRMMKTASRAETDERRWVRRRESVAPARLFADALGDPTVVAGVLAARGVETEDAARALLHPSLEQLHDPYLMLGMRESVARVLRAVETGERILIYGDYDVDGTTGTVVLRRALEVLGATTGYHVPHRFTEGYGIRRDVLERAKSEGYTLVISVDCGIRAHEPLEWARANSLDVIVTDHHLPDEDEGAPPAFAVLNPNQRGCAYPDKTLAGVGVAFKLAHAILRERGRENLVPGFLKVVAIGTVADVAQLTGENRAIVSLGLSDLHRATNPGLRALMEVAGCGDGARAFDLGFRLGP